MPLIAADFWRSPLCMMVPAIVWPCGMEHKLVLVAAAGLGLVLGCEMPPSGVLPTAGYLTDPAFARAELTASLVNSRNGYSTLRLSHYATDDAADWDLLPEWNPPAEPIAAAELDAPGGASAAQLATDAAPLPLPVRSPSDPALLALGKAAFERYPAQLAQYLRVGLSSRPAAARAGTGRRLPAIRSSLKAKYPSRYCSAWRGEGDGVNTARGQSFVPTPETHGRSPGVKMASGDTSTVFQVKPMLGSDSRSFRVTSRPSALHAPRCTESVPCTISQGSG
jgi:hypothetical protein